jgi:hypothetical protein
VRAAALDRKGQRVPEFFDTVVLWPDGRRIFFEGSDDPYASRNGFSVERPVIEIEVCFEPAKPPRAPKLIASAPLETQPELSTPRKS